MLIQPKYAYLNAKLKGMYEKSLQVQDYENLIQQKSLSELLEQLQQKEILTEVTQEEISRRKIEKQLGKIVLKDIQKIKNVLDPNSRTILQFFFRKYEIREMKRILREQADSIQWDKLESNLQETIDFLFLNNTQKERLKKWISKIDIQTTKIFDLENDLDIAYWTQWYERTKKNKVLTKLIGKQIDLINILWCYRIKQNPILKEEVKIPIYYELTKIQLEELYQASDIQQMLEIIKKTSYREVFKNGFLEQEAQIYLYRLHYHYFKTKSFDIVVLICYFYLKEIEIKNIITILEGIRYQLTKEKIMAKLIY